jgi:hypothetical protein
MRTSALHTAVTAVLLLLLLVTITQTQTNPPLVTPVSSFVTHSHQFSTLGLGHTTPSHLKGISSPLRA